MRLVTAVLSVSMVAAAQQQVAPVWWAKYRYLSQNAGEKPAGKTSSLIVDSNVDVSNQCGPQSETFITLNPLQPATLAAGANSIFSDPMRGFFSSDSGTTWGGVDLPLPPPKGNGNRFGSDPSLAFDTLGNLFYSYIVVFFGNGSGVNGTEMAVARSNDGGRSYPFVNYFSAAGGSDHFNDKPMITADTSLTSAYKDNVYAAWDAATGGSSSGGVRFARSTDHGGTFTVTRIDDPSGPGRVIAAQPFVGPNGEVYVAWNDYAANTIAFNRSFDGGVSFGAPAVIARKSLAFDIAIPAISFRRALLYPSCDADRSSGANRGRLYCSWMDLTAAGVTNIFESHSDDRGTTWTAPTPVTDSLMRVDRFYQWLSVDPVNGSVSISFYDTRNDTTGERYMTDVYLAHSKNGVAWSPNIRVSTASSNEHDCNGQIPCSAIDYGNQYGDYEGLVSFGGTSHPVWTDSRRNQDASPGCRGGLAMEEVFTTTIR